MLFASSVAFADEWLVSVGGGNNLNVSGQTNQAIGFDWSFAKWKRSERQEMLFGISATAMKADTDDYDEMYALSFYPQLNLYLDRESDIQPFFFVRALGISYLSANQLGKRRQENHFAFQAKVGVGLYLPIEPGKDLILSLAFKHFSNANLFSENDGIDIPFVFDVGMKY